MSDNDQETTNAPDTTAAEAGGKIETADIGKIKAIVKYLHEGETLSRSPTGKSGVPAGTICITV